MKMTTPIRTSCSIRRLSRQKLEEKMNQIINMVLRLFLRKAVNKGIDAGIGLAARKHQARKLDREAAAAQKSTSDDNAKRAKQALRLVRRIGRF